MGIGKKKETQPTLRLHLTYNYQDSVVNLYGSYLQLKPIISRFPRIHQFPDDGFIRKQCKGELKSHLLRGLSGLVQGRTINEFRQHLPTLESRLG